MTSARHNKKKWVVSGSRLKILKSKMGYQYFQIVDHVPDFILGDRQILAKGITEAVDISKECFRFINHENSGMSKLSTNWAPRYLNANQKWYQVNIKLNLWHFQRSVINLFETNCKCCNINVVNSKKNSETKSFLHKSILYSNLDFVS